MLETRDPKMMRLARNARMAEAGTTLDDAISGAESEDLLKSLVELKDLLSDQEGASEETMPANKDNQNLLQVGYEMKDGRLRRLYAEGAWHLIFEPEYFHAEKHPLHLRQQHPTWNLKTGSSPHVRFGGEGSAMCAVCGARSHHLLTLAQVPPRLGVSSVERLTLEVCLSCLGWEANPLFYQHDKAGNAKPFAFRGKSVKPRFPAGLLAEAAPRLAATPRRWLWQDWALTNSRQNLHRLGGHPCWIQSPDYLRCPDCEVTMPFLIQLDSPLPTATRAEFLWGSGGICYGFWCDRCRISGFQWQCT
jgi:hypothetical protein